MNTITRSTQEPASRGRTAGSPAFEQYGIDNRPSVKRQRVLAAGIKRMPGPKSSLQSLDSSAFVGRQDLDDSSGRKKSDSGEGRGRSEHEAETSSARSSTVTTNYYQPDALYPPNFSMRPIPEILSKAGPAANQKTKPKSVKPFEKPSEKTTGVEPSEKPFEQPTGVRPCEKLTGMKPSEELSEKPTSMRPSDKPTGVNLSGKPTGVEISEKLLEKPFEKPFEVKLNRRKSGWKSSHSQPDLLHHPLDPDWEASSEEGPRPAASETKPTRKQAGKPGWNAAHDKQQINSNEKADAFLKTYQARQILDNPNPSNVKSGSGKGGGRSENELQQLLTGPRDRKFREFVCNHCQPYGPRWPLGLRWEGDGGPPYDPDEYTGRPHPAVSKTLFVSLTQAEKQRLKG